MRKNDARKWLHAILDLLPVLLIPIFAIYVRNENSTFNQEIVVPNKEVVNFNQLVKNGDFVNTDTWSTLTNLSTFNVSNNTATCLASAQNQSLRQSENFVVGHQYLVMADIKTNDGTTDISLDIRAQNVYLVYTQNTTAWQTLHRIVTIDNNETGADYVRVIDRRSTGFDTFLVRNFMLFDLSQMFGVGKEPTYDVFRSIYPLEYYSYTLSEKQLIDYGTITYNDTDVGSQMVYTLYNAVDKYFNFGNVFNLGQVYNWFSVNIFNGNPPLVVPIVWNIVLYEFVMDLIFLLYALFMFFIDFCTNLIDRFNTKCSGGK